ncbi:MAG: DUF2461 domain-containing protein [Acidocella sp.]|nr:DUF2461 domain-containing protein [Acidocella sp.]
MRKPLASKLHEDFPAPPFEGFAPGAFTFFKMLKQNQDKTWFAAHKAQYEAEVTAPMGALVCELSARFAKAGLSLQGDAKRSLFRINRDVRFSNDKSPYKTHAGAVMTRTGEKNSPGLLYIHLDPEGCFMAAGFYHPEPADLQILREGIVHHAAAWVKLEKALAGHGLALSRDDTLIRPPKGFEVDDEEILAALKLKSWVVKRELTQGEMREAGLVQTIMEFALAVSPVLKFGWTRLGVG